MSPEKKWIKCGLTERVIAHALSLQGLIEDLDSLRMRPESFAVQRLVAGLAGFIATVALVTGGVALINTVVLVSGLVVCIASVVLVMGIVAFIDLCLLSSLISLLS